MIYAYVQQQHKQEQHETELYKNNNNNSKTTTLIDNLNQNFCRIKINATLLTRTHIQMLITPKTPKELNSQNNTSLLPKLEHVGQNIEPYLLGILATSGKKGQLSGYQFILQTIIGLVQLNMNK